MKLLKQLSDAVFGTDSSEKEPKERALDTGSSHFATSSEEYQKPETISEAYNNPRYQNKIVIESPEGLFSTTDPDRASQKFKKLQEKHPDEPPVMTVIPKGTVLSVPTEKTPS